MYFLGENTLSKGGQRINATFDVFGTMFLSSSEFCSDGWIFHYCKLKGYLEA